MKKNKLLRAAAFSLSLGLVFAGCSDQFLQDKKQYGVFDEKSFASEVQTGWYIDQVYHDFYYGYNSPVKNIVGMNEDRSGWTEEKGGISNYLDPGKDFKTADDCPNYYGTAPAANVQNNPYTRIRNCNFLILNIDELGTNVSEEYKKTAKGQMYFLRGIQYFDLVRMYGGVPITLKVENAEAENPAIKYPRASVAECVEQIIKDFDAAAELLPMQWNAANYGRFTKAAALAMKSRVLLTYASPLFNENWDDPANERWQAALDAGLEAERELSAAGYGLYGSNAKEWSDMFLIDNSFCKEVIMVKLLANGTTNAYENNGWENSIRLKSQGGLGGVKAPKEMIDLFPMADGKQPTAENGYNEFNFFLNRDPRFYRTFAFSGSKWGYKDKEDDVVWGYRWRYTNENGNAAYSYSDANTDMDSPAFVRKMSNTTVENTFKYSGTDIFEYRYAELLLNIAECYAAKGQIDNCVSYLKQIRNRVGIPAANNHGIGIPANKYEALKACLYERRVELAYEGKRFFDMQRWMLYNDDGKVNGVVNNTCAKLEVTPLNGTSRTGHVLQYKTVLSANEDPLLAERGAYSVDPDSETFPQDLQALATFYNENFEWVEPETPMDNNGQGVAVTIDWKQRYYIFGLNRSALTSNPWLEQTIGWKDANSSDGTLDYQN